MARFTKQTRQEIIREFCLRRNADFDARLFEQEVRETGPSHPAYEWFEWNRDKAASEFRIWQARQFANGLRVSFKVEEIGRNGQIRVRQVDVPLVISPIEGRRSGGGYVITDPENKDHMAELCKQAAADLDRWLRRYQAAVLHVGGSVNVIERQLKLLEKASPQEMDEAA